MTQYWEWFYIQNFPNWYLAIIPITNQITVISKSYYWSIFDEITKSENKQTLFAFVAQNIQQRWFVVWKSFEDPIFSDLFCSVFCEASEYRTKKKKCKVMICGDSCSVIILWHLLTCKYVWNRKKILIK